LQNGDFLIFERESPFNLSFDIVDSQSTKNPEPMKYPIFPDKMQKNVIFSHNFFIKPGW